MSAKNKIDPDKFCYYPFTQMLLNPTGKVCPCCYNQKIAIGRVPQQTIEEIWNGQELRSLRREFLNGTPASCKYQMKHIQCHLSSQKEWNDQVPLTEVQENAPRRLDVRLNGKCNLSCVMCGVWKQPNGLYDSSDFWTYGPEKIFPNLMEIDVLGGEPLIQPDTYRLIDEISKVNQKCKWAFATNAHYTFSETLQKYLDKVSIRYLHVSLDSIHPQTYAGIRLKGDLKRVMETLEDLLAYRQKRGFDFIITMCVQQANWREIEEFLQFVKAKKAAPGLQFAYDPGDLSLLSLPRNERKEIVTYLEKLIPAHGEKTISPILLPMKDSFGWHPFRRFSKSRL